MIHFDVVVIGAGPAGEKAALKAAELGAKVAIVEKEADPGGAGIITGTIPSKAIRETTLFINQLKRKELSGFEVNIPQRLSVPEIFHRQRHVSKEMSAKIYRDFQEKGVVYYRGFASFQNPHQILVQKKDSDDVLLETKKTIIAVGTSPYHPPDIDFSGQAILDSDSILKIPELPRSLSIYGGGVIGCEYATIFTRLGTRVYLISPKPTLLNFIDHDLSLAMNYTMLQSKITLRLGEEYRTIEEKEGRVEVALQSGKTIETEYLLYANGRQGNSEGLKLENCGVAVNSRKQLTVNEYYQTSDPDIYAVGDIIGFPSLVSTGNEQGRIAARHAILGKAKPLNASRIPLAVYTIPEIAMVGETEETLTAAGVPYETGICYFRDLARAKLVGEEDGLLKLIFDPTSQRILGVHIMGYYASDLIHTGQAVIHYQGGLDYFVESVINYPTLSSAYKLAAIDGINRLKVKP